MSGSVSNPFSLAGQTALVTGGGTGLGWGIARCFVDAGARVVIVGRREQALQEAAAELGASACYRVHDIIRFDHNAALIDDLESTVGPIDILVNNAGIHLKKPAVETTEREFQSLLDTHVTAAFSLSRALAPRMIQRDRGSILVISSMASLLGVPQIIAYTSAKTACLGLVRGLAAELSPHGVRVNAIMPGWIRTPMTDKALAGDADRRNRILARTPMKRLGEPSDVGQAAVYLSSPAARFVTGTVLTVDGGASIGF